MFVVIFLRYFLGIMTDLQEVEKIQKSPRWEIKFDLISWQCENSFPQAFHLTGQNFSLSKLSTFLGLPVAANLFLTIHVIGTGRAVTT